LEGVAEVAGASIGAGGARVPFPLALLDMSTIISIMTRRRKREETCWNLLFVIFRYSVIYMLLTNKGEGDDGIDEAIEAIESEEE
jgi:hypothetical protein